MSRLIPLIAVALIAIRPLSGCCECHAPLLAAIGSAWHEAWGGEHHDDCCQHSEPSHDSDHQGEKCPSCESTKNFVKVASPQLAKSAIAWHFLPAIATASCRMESPALCHHHSSGPLSWAGLRAHLVLGVMLI
jgi:hypothetical protein